MLNCIVPLKYNSKFKLIISTREAWLLPIMHLTPCHACCSASCCWTGWALLLVKGLVCSFLNFLNCERQFSSSVLQARSHQRLQVSKQSAGRPSSLHSTLLSHLEVVVFVGVCCEQVFGALDVVGQLRLSQVGPKLLQHLGCGFHCHGKVLYGLRRKKTTCESAASWKHLLHFGNAGVDVMCAADSRSGGVSTDCDSTPGFLPARGSAGLCPHSRAGPTESSASRSAKHTQRITTSSSEHDVHRTVQL